MHTAAIPLEPSGWDHALALLFGVVLPVSTLLQSGRFRDAPPGTYDTQTKITFYWTNAGTLLILATGVVGAWLWQGRSLAELGLARAPERPVAGLALAAAFLVFYGLDTRAQLATPERLAATRERWRRDTPFMPQTRGEIAHSLVLITGAAVGEEILFRAFLIQYAAAFTGAWIGPGALALAAAVAAPAVVFALCHLYQGWRPVAKIVLLSGFFGAIYVVTGSLWIPIALHFVVDLVGSLLGPQLLDEPQEALPPPPMA